MRRTFESMLNSIRGTRHMANQMLSLARAEQINGLLQERSTLDIVELARDVASDFAVLALKKTIDLAFEGSNESISINGNAIMLREMLSNLLDNALRYTPHAGHVTVTVSSTQDHVRLTVSDDGPGIPVAEQEKVFQRFYRILGNGDTEGSGLGLCIVREIVLAHNGTVEFGEGPDGRGLSIEVSLEKLKVEPKVTPDSLL
jgi:two-component system sensor histidine kinase TctE